VNFFPNRTVLVFDCDEVGNFSCALVLLGCVSRKKQTDDDAASLSELEPMFADPP
jgi:hypothetical protein